MAATAVNKSKLGGRQIAGAYQRVAAFESDVGGNVARQGALVPMQSVLSLRWRSKREWKQTDSS